MPDHHSFHIPVMGLGFTIDTPLKVARFGISSVVSIVEDDLVEEMRKFHCERNARSFTPIAKTLPDHRALRITAYLDLLHELVQEQTERLRNEAFTNGNDIIKYFMLLPTDSPVRLLFEEMMAEKDEQIRAIRQTQLRNAIVAGSIDVNIMTKCDRPAYLNNGEQLPAEFSDASAALRGFALSKLSSGVVFSAGLNPRLYSYCASFADFYPDEKGNFRKKIILKVSDFRSAAVQGRFFAKKGLWVSEYRIESGLNCGGHAFATQGVLMGPILEEFRQKREELATELFSACKKYWEANAVSVPAEIPQILISAQGGIGTAEENLLLLNHYEIDSTGWGSPFLLVPEVTNVDALTLQQLSTAKPEDYYVSDASPLGVSLNNFRGSSSNVQRLERISKNRPGSPCYKKYLAFNTEFGAVPICTASREYQHNKIKQITEIVPAGIQRDEQIAAVKQKECLCEGLGASARNANHIESPHHLTAVAVCPGPNLAYFSGVFSLREMVNHIYGRTNLLNNVPRSHMFVNELSMYVDFLKKEMKGFLEGKTERKVQYFEEFKSNLLSGIAYYRQLLHHSLQEAKALFPDHFSTDLIVMENQIAEINMSDPMPVFR